MKKFSFILRIATGSLVAIVALVFTVLEATLLITLDFQLYERVLLAIIQILLRLLIAGSVLTLGIVSIVKNKSVFLSESIYLFALSAVMIPFVSNGFGIHFTAVSALFILSQLLFSKAHA